ncbi:MAG: fructose-bisphosphatase class II [Leptospiraceae bacterium]|nr:fructose-bisphosphatase class II [Leptospiraceae bacterium]
MLDKEYQKVFEGFRNVTEKTAEAVYPFFGKNDKNGADHVAVEKMREELSKLPFLSRIILGEGEKDNAPMLFEGEELGNGEHLFDLVVDPLECTTNFSKGLPNSMVIIAFAEKNCLAQVPGTYMEQWIAGPNLKSPFEPDKPLRMNLEKLCESYDKNLNELLIVIQDRMRHDKLIEEVRNLGCGISLIDSGSLTAALDICLDKGHYDALIGTFGAPEGLIAAIVAKCTNSEMKGILRPHKESYKEKWQTAGFSDGQILDKDEFVTSSHCGFIATCLSTNIIMKGITRHHHLLHGNSLTLSTKGIEITEWETNKNGL